MIKAILYKEWIKLCRFYPVCFIAASSFTAYAIFRTGRIADFRGVEHIWEILLEKDAVPVSMLQFIPLFAGILLAIVQFVPEMVQKRLKLTLHLPFPHNRMIFLMLLTGATLLVLLFLTQGLMVYVYFSSILVQELVLHIMLTAFPWAIAGLAAYFCTAWICLEPTWKWRIAEVMVSAGLCRIFFISSLPRSYDGMLGWLLATTVLMSTAPLLSVWRFRQGCQD